MAVARTAAARAVPQTAAVLKKSGFIDTAVQGKAGEIQCSLLRPAFDDPGLLHQFSPSGILAQAEKIYDACPRYLFTVRGESFEYGESVSETLSACIPSLINRIEELGAQGEQVFVGLGEVRSK